MHAAAIDIGTNTTLLLIAERDARGDLCARCEEAAITRLGQGVDRARAFAPEAIARTCEVLNRYADAISERDVARVRVVGTSAMRDAAGGEPLRELVQRRLGVNIEVIAGDEEARLAFRGALSGLDARRTRVVL